MLCPLCIELLDSTSQARLLCYILLITAQTQAALVFKSFITFLETFFTSLLTCVQALVFPFQCDLHFAARVVCSAVISDCHSPAQDSSLASWCQVSFVHLIKCIYIFQADAILGGPRDAELNKADMCVTRPEFIM